uniref:Mediator of RNA polymerase II transcription subunit 15 n=1 Tax=Arion vulgaris TaxID=1028688 RepID=A0A0B6Y134_9EUPU
MERGEMVAGVAEQFMSCWTSPVFRNRCAIQIELVRSEANPQVDSDDVMEKFFAQKTSQELEEFIFCQSKTKEDYISLVSEMVMMLRQHRGRAVINTQLYDEEQVVTSDDKMQDQQLRD